MSDGKAKHIHAAGKGAIDALRALAWPAGFLLNVGPPAGRRAKKLPDATVVFPDGTCARVEVKKVSTGISQLRALEYQILVVWREEDTQWWVVPPDQVMLLASRYSGQHTHNPLECCNPGRPNGYWDRWKIPVAGVPNAIETSWKSAMASAAAGLADKFRKQIKDLAAAQKDEVRRIIK